MKTTIHIWDLPLRLFHWLLAASVIAAYVTAKLGGELMDWHGRLGIFILGLLLFRIVWGFIGSTHARFSSFFPTFGRVRTYLRGQWQGVGHNPLGAFSVLALLSAVAVQIGTGLFANDDITFEGPFYHFINKSLSDQLTGWHSLLFNVLLGLVVLHLLAIIFYRWVKKTNLVKPMLTGKKDIPTSLAFELAQQQHTHGVGAFRLIISLLLSSTIAWGVAGGVEKFFPAQAAAPQPSTSSNADF